MDRTPTTVPSSPTRLGTWGGMDTWAMASRTSSPLLHPDEREFDLFAVMSAFTDPSFTICRIWAVQSLDGYPFGRRPAGKQPDTCATFGFASDAVIGDGCFFGSSTGSSDCGYNKSNFYCYGHVCDACQVGKGTHQQFTFMGPFADGRALTNVAGDVSASCRTGLSLPVADE